MVSFYLLLAMHVYSLYDKYWVLMMYAFHLVNNTFNKKNFKYLKKWYFCSSCYERQSRVQSYFFFHILKVNSLPSCIQRCFVTFKVTLILFVGVSTCHVWSFKSFLLVSLIWPLISLYKLPFSYVSCLPLHEYFSPFTVRFSGGKKISYYFIYCPGICSLKYNRSSVPIPCRRCGGQGWWSGTQKRL